MSDPLSALLASGDDGDDAAGEDGGDIFSLPKKNTGATALFADDDEDDDDDDLFGRLASKVKSSASTHTAAEESLPKAAPKQPPKPKSDEDNSLATADISRLEISPAKTKKNAAREGRSSDKSTERTEGRLLSSDMFDDFPTMRKSKGEESTVTITDFNSFVKKTSEPSTLTSGGGLFDEDDDDARNDDDDGDDDNDDDDDIYSPANDRTFKNAAKRGLFSQEDEDDEDERKIDDLFVAQSGVLSLKARMVMMWMTTSLQEANQRRWENYQKRSKLY